jgi:two-component system phosphate regulon sensor histidine kinase PhoR
MALPQLALDLLDALEEPALLIAGERTLAANSPARALLGRQVVGQNVRFAIRQPQVLDAILARREGRMEVLGIGGVERSTDVSIRKLADDLVLVRLADRSARRAAERAQIDFVANASHELRTPLAAVLGYSETLAEPGDLEEGMRRRFGEQIHIQAGRMMQIIQDLMGLSRIEANRFVVPREPVPLASLAKEAVEAAGPLAEGRHCRIELDLARDLAPLPGDYAQLRQVVDNLLNNALRYGCRNPGDLITVAVRAKGGWQSLLVRDSGDGIAAEHLPRLTERFYRVDAARSRDSGGTGLGLAIVKQIVERHRGLLEIRSQPGQGTEVEVRLPTR